MTQSTPMFLLQTCTEKLSWIYHITSEWVHTWISIGLVRIRRASASICRGNVALNITVCRSGLMFSIILITCEKWDKTFIPNTTHIQGMEVGPKFLDLQSETQLCSYIIRLLALQGVPGVMERKTLHLCQGTNSDHHSITNNKHNSMNMWLTRWHCN
jgi:hypothetical protein